MNTKSRHLTSWILILLLCCAAFLWATPFFWMVTASLSGSDFSLEMGSIFPHDALTIENFQIAWESTNWISLYSNTLIFAIGTLLVQLITITTTGYIFAYYEFRGKTFLFYLLLLQLMIVPVVLMIPNMMTLKDLGLLNTLVGTMMPYFASAFGVFLMRQSFLSIPKELEDAAIVEGCQWYQTLFYILIPLTKPALLSFAIVSITFHWNEYLWPLMTLNDPDKQVLTIGLVSFAMGSESGGQWGVIGAGTLMICLPLLIAFLLFQKHFLRSFGFSGIK